jgi:hypothetical protein
MDLVGVREVSEILGWDPGKVSVYLQRKKLPEPIARLAAGPVWHRHQIEAFARGDAVVNDNTATSLPEEHLRAILWAYFEAARVGLLQPVDYGDPLPWAVDGKPPGHARSLPGLSFPVAYNELWPEFLQVMLYRSDLDELLDNPRLLWDEAVVAFDKLRSTWELQASKTPTPKILQSSEKGMTLSEASAVLELPRDPDGPLLSELDHYRDARLAKTTDPDHRARIWQAFHVAATIKAKGQLHR